ncbi:MAG: hypothetical protein GVY34_12730 [Alphaproteobacteria bacterium]|jgi:hypothetical protein|nr:hypothetical protein [Alphaproteobacteria bacterium]
MWVAKMNRQVIIRGAAVSTAAIAASVFLAGQFLGDRATIADGDITDAPVEMRSASVVGSFGSATSKAEKAPVVETAALDKSADRAAATTAEDSFQPELTFAETSQPVAPRQPVESSLCDASLSAVPAIDGLMEIRLDAPCNTNERVVISHGDLAYSASLDEAGAYTGYVPALAADARIDAFLADDTYLQAQTEIADHNLHARMIVQWSGAANVGLHAFHRGAGHGEKGHISVLNPFDAALEEAFLVGLGDSDGVEPMLAQVYSVPVEQAADSRVQLELGVDAETCGTDVVVFVLSTHGEGAGSVEELSVAMPECGSGDGLVIVDLPFNPVAPAAGTLEFTADQS